MVICAVVGCSRRSDRRKGAKGFFRLPAILHQGKETRDLSKRRQELWLCRLNRKDCLVSEQVDCRVCPRHFISGIHDISCIVRLCFLVYIGHPSELYDSLNPDWAASLFLGYNGSIASLTRTNPASVASAATCTAAIAGHSNLPVATCAGITPDSTRYEHSNDEVSWAFLYGMRACSYAFTVR